MVDTCYVAAGLSDTGRVRQGNQDALTIDGEHGLYVVSDGMGGMELGDLAARYVVERLPALIRQRLAIGGNRSLKEVPALLEECIDELGRLFPQRVGKNAGATVVLALLSGDAAYIAHLGDSPAYFFRAGVLKRLTKDHNVASVLMDIGRITPEEARIHPMRHRLTAYVGMEGKLCPEVTSLTFRSGDRLLLCSDGLTGMVCDEEIAQTLAEISDPAAAVEWLIGRANEAGGHDNVTAVLIDRL